MPRDKSVHMGMKLLSVDFERQAQPGGFEYVLCYLVDHELDLSAFRTRSKTLTESIHTRKEIFRNGHPTDIQHH
ncbi:MAG TPA: hypothetical protein VF811_11750 [Parasulfuritortus sp.]